MTSSILPTNETEAGFPPQGYIPGISKVPGITVYLPGEAAEKHPELVDFKCPQCGATIAYNVDAGKLTCEHCGYSQTPEQQRLGRAAEGFEFKVETIERSEKGWGETRKELACQRCGGVVSVSPDTLAFTCPFCGSNKVLVREPMEDVLRPHYLIPFKINPAGCAEITHKWLGSSWMAPSGLRSAALTDKFNPLYIPYWTFNAVCNAIWKAQVAHEKTQVYYENGERKEYHTVEWREESGKVQKEFSDLLVPGTTRLHMSALGMADNYDISDLILYEPGHLAGMQAQAYDLPLEKAWDAGRQIMRERVRQACLDRASSAQVRNFTMSMDFDKEQWRYILVPIYTSVYRYQEKTFQILINGQTGKIAGPRPVDWEKVWLVIVGMLSPGLLLALVSWLFSRDSSGQMITALGLFLVVVAVVIGVFMVIQARGMENV